MKLWLLLSLFLSSSVFSQDEGKLYDVLDTVEYEASDSFHEGVTYKITTVYSDKKENLEHAMQEFAKEIESYGNIPVFATNTFFNEAALKKRGYPKNEIKPYLLELEKKYFSNVNFEHSELGEEYLSFIENGSREPSSVHDVHEPRIMKRFANWLVDWLPKNRRWSLTLVRTSVNATVVASSFMAGGMDPLPASMLGILVGSMSGTLMWFNQPFLKSLDTNIMQVKLHSFLLKKMPFLSRLGLKEIAFKKSNFIAATLKWAVVEAGILAVLRGGMHYFASVNMIEFDATFAESLHYVIKTTIDSVWSQGVLDTANAKTYRPAIEKAEKLAAEALKLGNTARAAKLQRIANILKLKSDAIVVGGSMTWAAAAAFRAVGLNIDNYLFYALGATGGLGHARLFYLKLQEKNNNMMAKLRKFKANCNVFFRNNLFN
ncbi:MAG: hypothetical protein H6621_13105 [Halobacteriovoraceae bacterium]|nr:hypothetical protein [Halobacteriovoraceae bacterium]